MVNSVVSADYEMPHFRRISPGQYKQNKITTLEASNDRQQSKCSNTTRAIRVATMDARCHAVVMTVENQKDSKKARDRGTVGGTPTDWSL